MYLASVNHDDGFKAEELIIQYGNILLEFAW